MGFVNAIVVGVLDRQGLGVTDPWIDRASGDHRDRRDRGTGATDCSPPMVRIQPIVATLGTYLVLTGLTVTIVPEADRHGAGLAA